jgi:membrane protein required for colicin V production
MDSLNTLDLGIIALVSISAIFGVMRGFVKEAMSLVTWITAIFIATMYCTTVANHLTVISLLSLRYLIAFLLLVLATLMVGGLISHWVSRLITLTGFSVTDRIVGTLFGTVRGVLVVAIALLVTENAIFAQQNTLFKHSILIPHFKPVANWIKKSLPEDLLHKLLGPNLEGSAEKTGNLKTTH